MNRKSKVSVAGSSRPEVQEDATLRVLRGEVAPSATPAPVLVHLQGHKCPHCGEPLEIPLATLNNCQRYFSAPIFRARCCGYGVRMRPQFTFTLEAAPRDTNSDMFGISLEQD